MCESIVVYANFPLHRASSVRPSLDRPTRAVSFGACLEAMRGGIEEEARKAREQSEMVSQFSDGRAARGLNDGGKTNRLPTTQN